MILDDAHIESVVGVVWKSLAAWNPSVRITISENYFHPLSDCFTLKNIFIDRFFSNFFRHFFDRLKSQFAHIFLKPICKYYFLFHQ